MKDTIITAKRKQIELLTLLICFCFANVINLYSIISYNGSYVELFTSLGYVTITTILLYAVWGILRLLFYTISSLVRR